MLICLSVPSLILSLPIVFQVNSISSWMLLFSKSLLRFQIYLLKSWRQRDTVFPHFSSLFSSSVQLVSLSPKSRLIFPQLYYIEPKNLFNPLNLFTDTPILSISHHELSWWNSFLGTFFYTIARIVFLFLIKIQL